MRCTWDIICIALFLYTNRQSTNVALFTLQYFTMTSFIHDLSKAAPVSDAGLRQENDAPQCATWITPVCHMSYRSHLFVIEENNTVLMQLHQCLWYQQNNFWYEIRLVRVRDFTIFLSSRFIKSQCNIVELIQQLIHLLYTGVTTGTWGTWPN